MPSISRDEAKKLLESKGYKVGEFLGSGANSYVFKCTSPQKQFVAAKLCAPGRDSLTSLRGEILADKELEALEKRFWQDFKSKVKDRATVAEALKKYKQFFKYITKPTLVFAAEGENLAIFEAPLATDAADSFYKDAHERQRKRQEKGKAIKSDCKEVKRAAKHALKGLELLHDKGMIHGDLKGDNILRTKTTGKTVYSLTDLATLRPNQFSSFKADIYGVGQSLLEMWLQSFTGYPDRTRWAAGPIYVHQGIYDKPFETQLWDGQGPRVDIVYTPNAEDIKFLNFAKRLTNPDASKIPTAEEALKDPFLR